MKNLVGVVVFDIDECICWRPNAESIDIIHRLCPECIEINQEIRGQKYLHVFAPQIEYLFRYLLNRGVRLAFFSSAVEERNEPLIRNLFTQVLGNQRYEEYLKDEQFQVFSRQHLKGKCTPYVKDLTTILLEGEHRDDAILVEDDYSYVDASQHPCLQGNRTINFIKMGLAIVQRVNPSARLYSNELVL